MSLIQHLNVIVDPQAPALGDYDPPGGVTGGGTPADATADPTEAGRNPYGRLVRTGGTGIAMARTKLRRPPGRNFNGKEGGVGFPLTPVAVQVTLPYQVIAGDLLVAFVFGNNGSSADTVSFSDSQGNGWTRAGSYQRLFLNPPGLNFALSVWYCLSPAGGPLTVSVLPSGWSNPTLVTVREYEKDYNGASPDGTAGNAVAAPTGAVATTGSVGVAGARGLVVGAVMPTKIYRNLFVDSPPFKRRSTHFIAGSEDQSDVSPFLFYGDAISDVSLAVTATQPTGTGWSPAYAPYIAVGASFRPHP